MVILARSREPGSGQCGRLECPSARRYIRLIMLSGIRSRSCHIHLRTVYFEDWSPCLSEPHHQGQISTTHLLCLLRTSRHLRYNVDPSRYHAMSISIGLLLGFLCEPRNMPFRGELLNTPSFKHSADKSVRTMASSHWSRHHHRARSPYASSSASVGTANATLEEGYSSCGVLSATTVSATRSF